MIEKTFIWVYNPMTKHYELVERKINAQNR